MLIAAHFIQDIDIIATYSDTSGAVRIGRVKMRDLSASWVWENPLDANHKKSRSSQVLLSDFDIDSFVEINNECEVIDHLSETVWTSMKTL